MVRHAFGSEINDINLGLLVEVWNKGVIWDRALGYHYLPLTSVAYNETQGKSDYWRGNASRDDRSPRYTRINIQSIYSREHYVPTGRHAIQWENGSPNRTHIVSRYLSKLSFSSDVFPVDNQIPILFDDTCYLPICTYAHVHTCARTHTQLCVRTHVRKHARRHTRAHSHFALAYVKRKKEVFWIYHPYDGVKNLNWVVKDFFYGISKRGGDPKSRAAEISSRWVELEAQLMMRGGAVVGTSGPTGHALLLDCRFEPPFGKIRYGVRDLRLLSAGRPSSTFFVMHAQIDRRTRTRRAAVTASGRPAGAA
ncbi:hypothetical protein EVAR_38006_1 [Eumeta japonica]|uniref:Uncharacterized protein n=1 Tax=Eumeta variegata TaxID=151549 RepID=A0A4C1WUB4_EUMVA|nr:hypothetical protein EVAR_38006_1 [Eumeta japonica]